LQGRSVRRSQGSRGARSRAGDHAMCETLSRQRSGQAGLLFATFTKFVDCCLEAHSQFIRWTLTPIMQKDDCWICVEHVVMDCYDVKSVCTQGLESWGDLGFEHRDVTSDDSIFVATDERRPGVESHACVYGRSHFLNREVVAAQRDLIDRASLLAC